MTHLAGDLVGHCCCCFAVGLRTGWNGEHVVKRRVRDALLVAPDNPRATRLIFSFIEEQIGTIWPAP